MTYTVEKDEVGKRLDVLLSEIADISRSAAARLIEEGAVTVSGKPSQKKYAVKCGDKVEIVQNLRSGITHIRY